jgi:hypothetical protein
MAQVIIRNLPPDIVARLKRRAEERGSLKDLLRRMPDVGRDEDFQRRPAKGLALSGLLLDTNVVSRTSGA